MTGLSSLKWQICPVKNLKKSFQHARDINHINSLRCTKVSVFSWSYKLAEGCYGWWESSDNKSRLATWLALVFLFWEKTKRKR